MKAIELYSLMFSPPWAAKLLHLFLSGALSIDNSGLKFELVYYALPFILDEPIGKRLSRANAASTFDSTFDSPQFRNYLLDKSDRISSYLDVTKGGLIYLGNYASLTLSPKISVAPTLHYQAEKDVYLRAKHKAAYNWGMILGKEDYLNIILKIGAYSYEGVR